MDVVLSRQDHDSLIVTVDGESVEHLIRSPEVSEATSKIAVHEQVRSVLKPVQRAVVKQCSIVAEGRDMGTVIFPDALIKFFYHRR